MTASSKSQRCVSVLVALVVLFAAQMALVGCASSRQRSAGPVIDEEAGTTAVYTAEKRRKAFDILLPFNWVFYHVTDPVVRYVGTPIAIGYSYVMPRQARHGINNFLNNLVTPFSALNHLLQGKPKGFGNELLRFAVNTTAGGLGFYDFADRHMDIEADPEDLGQTLGKWGLPEGPYIFLPLLGPTTLRDLPSFVTMSRDGKEWYRGKKLGKIRHIAAFSILAINGKSLVYGSYGESRELAKDADVSHYRFLRDNYVDQRQRKAKDLPPREAQ